MEKADFEKQYHNAASPKDYSDGIYLVYLELYETNDESKEILNQFSTIQQTLSQGYLCHMSIQQVPDLISALVQKNIAIYQLVRLVKIK